MTHSLHLARLPRTITAGVAALVLAASAAPAFAASESGRQQLCAGATLAECERQVLASRGIGAPAIAVSAAAPAPSSDAGLDWNAAALGAAAMAGLSLAGVLGAIAFGRRRDWRLSRSAATH